jgi:hypothetical protein
MQVIAFVIGREHARWIGRVSHHCVEVNHAVEGAAIANPFIHSHALRFLIGAVKALERRALEGDPKGVSVAPMMRIP